MFWCVEMNKYFKIEIPQTKTHCKITASNSPSKIGSCLVLYRPLSNLIILIRLYQIIYRDPQCFKRAKLLKDYPVGRDFLKRFFNESI